MPATTPARVPGFLSADKLQTASAEKRSQRLEDSYNAKKEKLAEQRKKRAALKKKFSAGRRKVKGGKKKGAAKPKLPHASSVRELKGVLAKDAYYAQNCHDYLETDPGRHKVLQDFDMDFAHEHTGLPENVLDAYKFPAPDYPQNFNPGAKELPSGKKKAGQQYPYVWEAHHMLPGSAFYYEDAEGHCFEIWQIQLILQSEYNLNHGHNMIPLPDESWAVPIHQLPQHPGDHPIYTQVVMKDLRRIAEDLNMARDQGMKHPDLKVTVFERLQELEDDYWKFLVKLGKKVARGVVAARRVRKPWVTYGTEKDALKYEWGALY